MICKNLKEARLQAQANADRFGVEYCVFNDTSGNAHAERHYTQKMYLKEIFYPKNKSEKDKETV